MALNQPPEAHALPCGHSIEDLWDRMQTGTLGLHERSCPHCLTATDGLAALADATRALRADTAGPPPDLLTRVMTAVQADVRRVRTSPCPPSSARSRSPSRPSPSSCATPSTLSTASAPDAAASNKHQGGPAPSGCGYR